MLENQRTEIIKEKIKAKLEERAKAENILTEEDRIFRLEDGRLEWGSF